MITKTLIATVATAVLVTTVPFSGELSEKVNIASKQVEAATAVKVIYKAKVRSKTLPVRESKSTKSKKLGTLKKDKTVSVISQSGSYSKIKYGKGSGWVASKSISQLKNATLIKGAPKKLIKTTLPYSDSVIRAVDVEQASLVNQSATWKVATKKKQLASVAKATGMRYSDTKSRIVLDFVDVGEKSGDSNFDASYFEISYIGKEIGINIIDSRETLFREGEYVLQTILRPYFPKSYKKIASMYYDDHYIHAGNRFSKAKKYDGLNLYIVGGKIRFWK